MSDKKVVSIEALGGTHDAILKNVMRMVPEKDKDDVSLQRLLAFRLRIDGEGNTREYLMRKIRDMIQCQYSGRLYDFLKNDTLSRACDLPDSDEDSPEPA